MTTALEYISSDFGRFHNSLRILINIDAHEFPGPADDWVSFRDNPWRYFMLAEDAVAQALWEIIKRRNERALERAREWCGAPTEADAVSLAGKLERRLAHIAAAGCNEPINAAEFAAAGGGQGPR